jgi:hypothetical protein
MDVDGELVGRRRRDEVMPVAVMEGLEGGRSGLSTIRSKRMMQWPLWFVAWSRWPVASLCGLQHSMREKV